MIKFIHTGDWQLGMTRYFLGDGAQERFDRARFESVRRLCRVARDEGCDFIAVCGDVFESNQVGRNTVLRALEALNETTLPVYLLPGNHDPLNDASVFRSRVFLENKPGSVIVVEDSRPFEPVSGVELVGAPWPAKRLADNPLHGVLDALEPVAGGVRVCLGHGEVDSLAAFSESAATLSLEKMTRAIEEGKAQFIALGDKHSPARIDERGAIWYAGTPEATAFREPDPGYVNLVEMEGEQISVRKIRTGVWSFEEIAEELTGGEDADRLVETLRGMTEKECRVVRLHLSGELSLSEAERLDGQLADLGHLFASLDARRELLHTRVGDGDIPSGYFGGFAAETVARLERRILSESSDTVARDALALLLRLSRQGGDGFPSPPEGGGA